jgi:hypothetical protein
MIIVNSSHDLYHKLSACLRQHGGLMWAYERKGTTKEAER